MSAADPAGPGDLDHEADGDVVVAFIKDECEKYLQTMLPVPVVLGAIAYFDASLRVVSIALVIVALGCMLTTYWLLVRGGRGEMQEGWFAVCNVNMVFRTAGHLLTVALCPDSLVSKIFAMVILPVSTTRQCHRMRPYRVYLLVHVAVCVLRFAGSLQAEWPWLLCTFVSAEIQYKIVEERIEKRRLVLELHDAKKSYTSQVAGVTMKNLLATFCDATVTMAPDTTIVESCPELEVLMSRQSIKGRQLAEFVEPSDLAAFQEHMDELTSHLCSDTARGAIASSRQEQNGRSVYLRSCCVRLRDSYAVLFDANLYSVCMQSAGEEPTVLTGVSEMAQSARKGKSTSRPHHRKPIYRMNFETGCLASMGSARAAKKPASSFAEGDVEVVKSAKTLKIEMREQEQAQNSRRRVASPVLRDRTRSS